MIIYETQETKITMELLYEKLGSEKEKIIKKNDKERISQISYYNLILTDQISAKVNKIENGMLFDFSIGNTVEQRLLLEPIKTKIKINNILFDIDVISSNQIEFIIQDKKLIYPTFSCKNCDVRDDYYFYNIIKHKDCQDTLIYENDEFFELKTEKKFKDFFPTPEKNEFKNPTDFDFNFDDYFNIDNHIKSNKFIYYNKLRERELFSLQLKDPKFFGNFKIFYGFPGIGKSITALHVLKYEINHKDIKTLYIHCKYLSLLNKEYKYRKIIEILLYEIPFLFYDDYRSYQECVDLIKHFKFSFCKTYINLLDEIINYIATKPCKYLIIFDQYNQSIDPEEKIKNISNGILNNESLRKKFYFCYLMSLNNKDVKQKKIEHLLGSNESNNITIIEVDKIVYDSSFTNLKKNDIYKKLGKTFKIYYELYNINEDKKLEEYYINKKQKIKRKIIKFYNNIDNIDNIVKEDELYLDGMAKLMRFFVDVPYTKGELESIIEYIHFKYFDIQKKENNFTISFFYPAVEEVMKEIYYSFIFNNKNFYDKLLSFNLIKGGGMGPCFEQIVICSLSPTSSSYNKIIPNFIINKKESVPYFIPKSNEVNAPYKETKIKLVDNTTYLIEQEIFGGKSIDFIIIECTGKKHTIYAFQVSTAKKVIFEDETIKDILNQMNEYISNNFFSNLNVKEDSLYFGYIFSKINEDKKEYKSMINSLNRKYISYSYFNHKDNIFYSYKKRKITSINEIVFNPFNRIPLFSFGVETFRKKRCMTLNKNPEFKITEELKNKIIKTLKIIYYKEIIELDFQECLNKEYILNFIYDFYFTQDNEGNSFIVMRINDKFNVYSLDNLININNTSKNYLLDDKCKYDCYFICFEDEEKKTPLYLSRERFLKEIKEPEIDKKLNINEIVFKK